MEDGPTVLTMTSPKELSSVTVDEFKNYFTDKLQETTKRVDILMDDVTYVDSVGLGALIWLHKKVVRHGEGSVRLINPTPDVLQILKLTRMHKIFEIVSE